jgi:Pectate lyase superfamily protein/Putative Ig domain
MLVWANCRSRGGQIALAQGIMRHTQPLAFLHKVLIPTLTVGTLLVGFGCVGIQPGPNSSDAEINQLKITTNSLPGGAVGAAYNATIAFSGGVAPYQWSVGSGSLPAGLSLSAASGAISGSPALAGTSMFAVVVQDSRRQTARANLAVAISGSNGSGNPTLGIRNSSLPNGTVGTNYSAALVISGGTAPYQWSVSGGALPKGLDLTVNTGAIVGMPSVAGSSTFGVQVQDANQNVASASLAITINAATSPLAVTTNSLPAGDVGSAYSSSLSASGGMPPYQWGISAGSLPTGLSLNGNSGAISGTPTASVASSFTAQVQDSKQATASANLSIQVAGPNTFKITTNLLPGGTLGATYSASIGVTGGTAPYQWSVSEGSLPPGTSLNTSSGAISGTPSASGNFNISALVTDSSAARQNATANFTIAITSSGPPVGAVVVTNFGATGNGTTDDTAAINSAIRSLRANGTLYFPCGTYAISSALNAITLSGVTVEGPASVTGGNCATLKLTGSSSFTALKLAGGGLSTSENLVADTASNTFTVKSGGLANLGIVAGSYAVVSDGMVASNGAGSPLINNQEVVKIMSVSGDTATIENTFSYTFTMVSPYPASQGCCPYVQKILNPLVGNVVRYLNLDATRNTGTNTTGISITSTVDAEIGNLQVSNFLGTGASGGVLMHVGYQNTLHDLVCNACGNGGSSGFESVEILRQSYPTLQNITVTNTASQKVFGFGLAESHFGNLNNVTVDEGGASGRAFKLLRASHNTLTNITAKNATGGDNGISVTDISTYNTFNNCSALNNTGGGIMLFGNHNVHNTFKNCTSMYNQGWQLGQAPDATGSYGDYHTTINGGKYCCARATAAIIEANSDNFTATGASISDDQGQAIDGLVINSANGVIENNTFSSLPIGTDIYAVYATSLTISGNSTPDGTNPTGLASLFRKAKSLYAALSRPFSNASQ